MLATSFIATEGVNVGAASKFICGDLLVPIAFPSSACPHDVDSSICWPLLLYHWSPVSLEGMLAGQGICTIHS